MKRRGAVASRLLLGAALAIFALLWAATAAAAAPRWLAPTNVSAAGTNTEDPRVAVDPRGDAVAVWQYADGDNFVIQAASREAGGTWSAPVELSAPGNYAYYPQVAIDAAGDAVAVWEYYDGTGWVIQAAGREAGGAWSAPVELSAPGQSAGAPQVALDAAGDAVVVWEAFPAQTIQAVSREAGGAWSAPASLSPPGEEAREPQVALDAEGGAVAVWKGYEGGNSTVQAASSAVGGAWSTPVAISTPASRLEHPQVALDADGGAVAVWERSDGANWSIQAASREAGGAWSPPVDLSAPGQYATESQVAIDPQGDAVAIWEDSGTIQAASREAGGTWSAPAELSASGSSPQVALDAEGDAVAVWRDYDGSNWGIQTASSAGGGAWSTPVALSVPAWNAERPQVALDAEGDAVAVWQRYDGSDEFVQAAFLDAAGPQLRGLSIPTSGTAGQALSFSVSPLDAFSTVGATSWSFGDGATAPGTATTHSYARAGTYTVTVTSADALGNASSATGAVTVTVAAAPVTPPAGSGGSRKAGRSGKAGKDAGATRATAAARARVKNGRALLELTCPASGPCQGAVVLSTRVKATKSHGARKKARARSIRIGAASFELAAGTHATVRVKLNAKGLALLKKGGRRGLRASLAGRGIRPGPLVLKSAPPRRRPAHGHR